MTCTRTRTVPTSSSSFSGPFSQWAIRPIKIDGKTYNCCEQYMMAAKARLFGDEESERAIMLAQDPAEQKAIGRMVKGFSKDKWEAVARDVVYRANMAKFTQHEDLLKNLLATGNRTIVEASPYDQIWGIGLRASDPRATDPSRWRGTNWLGEAIMRVRTILEVRS